MPKLTPILYSFRRCPYAMRARLAIASAGVSCELREIVLRDKAAAFLEASPKGTVPVVVTPDGTVLEESYDIMLWALEQNDPEGWLDCPKAQADDLIDQADGPFKTALDRYKYASRYEDVDATAERGTALLFLNSLDAQIGDADWLFGHHPKLADMAILPFVRQFSFVDRPWFMEHGGKNVNRWLDTFIASQRFQRIFAKYEKWVPGADKIAFPPV